MTVIHPIALIAAKARRDGTRSGRTAETREEGRPTNVGDATRSAPPDRYDPRDARIAALERQVDRLRRERHTLLAVITATADDIAADTADIRSLADLLCATADAGSRVGTHTKGRTGARAKARTGARTKKGRAR
ncbi:hypothetical protein ACFO4E_18005 [Nocardiopsis mangrovi]|uniref:Uncharacterized protein n=1 Tax=Nocardiopsis mangrovi TaxID=1179818 RepID=A0ABV9DZ73_9ACTN